MTTLRLRWSVLCGMILVAALSRLVPHPPNFTPLGGMALFGGAMFSHWLPAIAVPLGAMVLSDILLGVFVYGYGVWHDTLLFVYASLLLIVFLGRLVRRRLSVASVAGATLAGSLLFFLITNFGVWLVSCRSANSIYPPTPQGLLACYIAALPFLGNTLAGDFFYSGILFGSWAVLQRRVAALAEQPTATYIVR